MPAKKDSLKNEETFEAKIERELEVNIISRRVSVGWLRVVLSASWWVRQRIDLDVTIGSPKFVIPSDPADASSARLELAWGSVTATNSHTGGWDLKRWVHHGQKVETFQYVVDFQGAKAVLRKGDAVRPVVDFTTKVTIHTRPGGKKGEGGQIFTQVPLMT